MIFLALLVIALMLFLIFVVLSVIAMTAPDGYEDTSFHYGEPDNGHEETTLPGKQSRGLSSDC